jgi:hypothetical protein
MDMPRLKRCNGTAVDKLLREAFESDFHGQVILRAMRVTTRRAGFGMPASTSTPV